MSKKLIKNQKNSYEYITNKKCSKAIKAPENNDFRQKYTFQWLYTTL